MTTFPNPNAHGSISCRNRGGKWQLSIKAILFQTSKFVFFSLFMPAAGWVHEWEQAQQNFCFFPGHSVTTSAFGSGLSLVLLGPGSRISDTPLHSGFPHHSFSLQPGLCILGGAAPRSPEHPEAPHILCLQPKCLWSIFSGGELLNDPLFAAGFEIQLFCAFKNLPL